ncbi:MAG: RNA polymerase sigma factor [Nanoarchaeota archaeon]|nr:RNA polymerase sigma factor [Nanoarchaeota archaeon]
MKLSDLQKENYGTFIQNYRPEMLSMAQKLGCNASDAEDIVNDVLVNIIEKESNDIFHKPKSWFYVVIKNRMIDYFRRQGKMELHESPEEFESYARDQSILDPYDTYSKSKDLEDLLDKMSKLSEGNRAALELHLLGYSGQEASQKLGIDYFAYATRVRRGKKELQQGLQEK